MSDDEEQINPKTHKNLLQAISNLGKTQHIRKSTRSEPQRQQDEFQLLKATKSNKKHPVGLYDVVKVLKGTKKHLDTGRQLKIVQGSKKVLDKPLEKPAAERLKRTLGYEEVKKQLTRWDAAVAQNRSAETQVFPLSYEKVYIDTSQYSKPLPLAFKSDLQLKLEQVDAELAKARREAQGDFDDRDELAKREEELLKQKLTRDELRAKRNELANLKIRESQKNAKARLKNKIKSKKYHKLLKRQKLQEHMKEFELLQKTNPEAALEKLSALEKTRVLERASLRHKNTGAWAKNLQVRAKYDKDVRKDLAEQLQISREMTQKKTDDDEEESEGEQTLKREGEKEDEDYDPFNPWTKAGRVGAEKEEENGGKDKESWRKYWLERNKNEKLLEEYRKMDMEDGEGKGDSDDSDNDDEYELNGELEEKKEIETDESQEEKIEMNGKLKKEKRVSSKSPSAEKPEKAKPNKKKPLKANSKGKQPKMENGWVVEEIEDSKKPSLKTADINIDDLFDEKEDEIKRQLTKKLKIMSKNAKRLAKVQQKRSKAKGERDVLKNLKDLSFKNEKQRPEIDEELNNEEVQNNADESQLNETLKIAQANEEKSSTKSIKSADNAVTSTIDPSKLATVKLKQHHNNYSALNENLDGDGDADMDDLDDPMANQQMTISQAFEDDDIIADFNKDKEKESELKNTEIELSMPGWGSWAGAGISAEQQAARKQKRLLLKLAPEEKRRDDNKGGIFINESASKQLRTHLVAEVPFPFTTVADYEASIRAPIGRNFVPETAFRMLTRPAVITKKGKIIEPMDEEELVKEPRKFRREVDRRIRHMEKEKEKELVEKEKEKEMKKKASARGRKRKF